MGTGGGGTTRRALLGGILGGMAAVGLDRASAARAEDGMPDGPAAQAPADVLLSQLSLPEKIAQLFMFVADGTSMTPAYANWLKSAKPGGVILLGHNIGWIDEVAPFVAAIHASNEDLPPLVALDQEGGLVTRLPGDPTSGAVELGQLPNPAVRSASRDRANFVRSFGFDVNFAPVADVAYGPESAMAGRTFGSDPRLVADKVAAVVRGSKAERLAGAAKHFPGLGRTTLDSHVALPEVDLVRRDWLASDALPFRAAIDAGVEMVMLGHMVFPQWDDLPTSLSAVAIETLRTDLGFDGVVVTDDLGMGALAQWDPFDALDRAFAAGVDLLLYAAPPVPPADLIAHLRSRVEEGTVPESRVDQSVRRLLRVKVERGDG